MPQLLACTPCPVYYSLHIPSSDVTQRVLVQSVRNTARTKMRRTADCKVSLGSSVVFGNEYKLIQRRNQPMGMNVLRASYIKKQYASDMYRSLLWLLSGRCITTDILQKSLNHTFVHWFENFSLVRGHGLFKIEASSLEDPR
jgi:hypothetical protein